MLTFNSIYLLLLIPVFVGWFAQWRVQQSFYKYLNVTNKKGITGTEITQTLLSHHEINIPVLESKRVMVNYYNPQDKTLHISGKVARNKSITSMGIVAHEVEHALQDKQGCRFMVLRNKMAKNLALLGQFSPLV
ncbi:MAG: zinc metallopeptidase, partial [Arcobacteraceae bacterium]